ncbi:unnamed protein product [marine sediment metagenome]|uniref:Uncharacterized protein n=1 Tax=marine sediment metagenome TaxID=412755 RepID=X1ILC6_9ZZZZ
MKNKTDEEWKADRKWLMQMKRELSYKLEDAKNNRVSYHVSEIECYIKNLERITE